MLLGVSAPPDTIDVEELSGQDGPFAVRLTIVQFEKRMKVSRLNLLLEVRHPVSDFPFLTLHVSLSISVFSPLGWIWKHWFRVKRDDSTHQPGP